ncbi:MAG: hypothetical protein NVS9B2_01670 [Steroidobacteraceae bacterium]
MHMNKPFAVGISMATLCLLSAAPGQAALVTYQASGTIDQTDNAAMLPGGLSAASVGDALSLNFTVNTNTPGATNSPGTATYQSPLVSASVSFGSGTLQLGVDSSVIGISSSLSGGAYFSEYFLTSGSTVPFNFTGNASEFELITAGSSAQPLNMYTNASLSNAPLQASTANVEDTLLVSISSYIDGVYQSTSDVVVGSDIKVSGTGPGPMAAPEIDPASASAALTFLLGGLAVLRGRRAIKTAGEMN